MPKILEAIGVWLYAHISGMVARVMISLGVGVVSYTGVVELGNEVVGLISARFDSVGEILYLLSLAGIDVFISLILSAHIGLIAWIMAATGFKRFSFMAGGNQ